MGWLDSWVRDIDPLECSKCGGTLSIQTKACHSCGENFHQGKAGGGGQVMPRSQAEKWAKGSKIPGPLYHMTSAENASSIRENGFDVNRSQTNQYYGQGVYLAQPGSESGFYGNTKLEARVRVKKPYTYLSDDPPLTSSRGPLGREIDEVRSLDPSLSRKAALTHVLKKNGFDSVIGLEDGDHIVVVLDPKNIAIVGED